MTAILEKKERSGYQVVETKNLVMRSPTDNMDVAVPGEGMYRLTCRAADRSGNTAEKTTAFSVDATPPVITGLDAIGGKYYKSFSIPSALSSFVRDATSTVLGAYINDEKAQPGQEVIKEGKYTLTLYAEDEAHNWSEDTAEFIVDHTAPQIVLSGFDRDGNIRKGSMVTVSLSQSADMLKSVLFNGSSVSVSPDNRACFEVNDYGDYTIDVVAEDPAGNVTDTSIHTSCYMYPAPVARFIGKQEELVSDIASTAQEADKKGVIFGLISMLSGAAGIVYKVKSRG